MYVNDFIGLIFFDTLLIIRKCISYFFLSKGYAFLGFPFLFHIIGKGGNEIIERYR